MLTLSQEEPSLEKGFEVGRLETANHPWDKNTRKRQLFHFISFQSFHLILFFVIPWCPFWSPYATRSSIWGWVFYTPPSQGFIQWTFNEHLVNIQWTFNEHSVNIQWTFSEHSVNIQWTFSAHSVNIQWTFSEHSVRIEVDAGEPSSQLQGALEENSARLTQNTFNLSTWVSKMRVNKTNDLSQE
jgi:hypothetical protein